MQDGSSGPEEGASRFAADGTIEVFDGTAWAPYQPVFDDGYSVVFKGAVPAEPEDGGSASDHP